MKELVLTTIGNIQHKVLNTIFTTKGINITERKNKQPETQELLFYCSPETYLATYSFCSKEQPSVLFKIWMQETKKQMEHVIANPEGCWLVDLDYAATKPGEFIHFVKESLEVELTECPLTTVDVLTLAKQSIMLVENDAVQEVYEDIVAAADYFNPAQSFTALDRITQYFNRLEVANERTREVEIETDELKIINGKLQLTLDDVTSENESIVLQITQLQEELEASASNNAVLQSESEKLTSEENKLKKEIDRLSQVNKKQQAELGDVNSENELALLQVAQLQEELEASASNNAVLQSESEKLTSEENKLKKEMDQLGQVNKKQQAELGDVNSENELALLQVAQLQEELDTIFSNNVVLQGENKKLTSEENRFKEELEQLGQVNKKQQAELEDVKSKSELALLQVIQRQKELEDVKSKSALVLLQVTQLQEELEVSTSNNAVLQSENKLSLLQVAHLQEELKAILSNNAVLLSDNKKLTSEESKLKHECDEFNLVSVKQQAELEDIKTENELALLQIAQLQEELEIYFIKLQTANTVELRTTFPHLTVSTLKESLQLSKLLSLN